MIGNIFKVIKVGKFLFNFYEGLKADAEKFENEKNNRKHNKDVVTNKKPKRTDRSKRNP